MEPFNVVTVRTGIIEQSDSQIRPAVSRARNRKNVVEPDSEYFVLHLLEHDIGLTSSRRCVYLNTEEVQPQRIVIQGCIVVAPHPVVARPETQ